MSTKCASAGFPANLLLFTTKSGIDVFDFGDYFRFMLPPTDGTTGEDWITRLESNGFHVQDYAKQVLRSPDFKPTKGLTTDAAVLKGMIFTDNDRITKKILAEADKRKRSKPNAELACLIRSWTRRSKRWVCGTSLPCTNRSTTPTAFRPC